MEFIVEDLVDPEIQLEPRNDGFGGRPYLLLLWMYEGFEGRPYLLVPRT